MQFWKLYTPTKEGKASLINHTTNTEQSIDMMHFVMHGCNQLQAPGYNILDKFKCIFDIMDWKPDGIEVGCEGNHKAVQGVSQIDKYLRSIDDEWDSLLFHSQDDEPKFEWRRFISYSRNRGEFQFGDIKKRWTDFDPIDVFTKIQILLSPDYGYCHTIPASFRPIFYGKGICSGQIKPWNENKEIAKKIGAWNRYMISSGNDTSDCIRQVYNYNYLTSGHCKIPCFNGLNINEWVADDFERGTFHTLDGGNASLWIVPDSSLEAINSFVERTPLYFGGHRKSESV